MHIINIKSSLIKQATKWYCNASIQNEIAPLQNISHSLKKKIFTQDFFGAELLYASSLLHSFSIFHNARIYVRTICSFLSFLSCFNASLQM